MMAEFLIKANELPHSKLTRYQKQKSKAFPFWVGGVNKSKVAENP